jgi:hypothetical protein
MQLARRFSIVFSAALYLICASPASKADTNQASKGPEQKFAAILIWGTDGEKPEGKNLKDVDANLRDKFKKIFKWKHYFEVSRKPFTMHPGDTHMLKLSHKCDIKVLQSEKEGLEVELYGEGKFVVKRKQTMPLNDIFILAGDDKNATAWFVVIKPE